MDNSIVVTITEDGNLLYLAHENTEFLSELGQVAEQRASHVEPDNVMLRFIFHLVRTAVSDDSRIAEFTRHWPCLWRINTASIDGPILPERFRNRKAAIEREIEYVNEQFLARTIHA